MEIEHFFLNSPSLVTASTDQSSQGPNYFTFGEDVLRDRPELLGNNYSIITACLFSLSPAATTKVPAPFVGTEEVDKQPTPAECETHSVRRTPVRRSHPWLWDSLGGSDMDILTTTFQTLLHPSLCSKPDELPPAGEHQRMAGKMMGT